MHSKSGDAGLCIDSVSFMRPADGLHVEWIEDEAVVLDPSTEELHYLNAPAALTYALILEHGFERGLDELRSLHAAERDFEEKLSECLGALADKGILLNG